MHEPNTLRFTWAVRDAELKPRQKALLWAMASYANEANQCWPSYASLGLQIGCSESTVKREVKGLEALGWLRRQVRRGRLHGSETPLTNLFTLRIPSGSDRSGVNPSDRSGVTYEERQEERQVEEGQEVDPSKRPVSKTSESHFHFGIEYPGAAGKDCLMCESERRRVAELARSAEVAEAEETGRQDDPPDYWLNWID